jgi:hypothetical protein
VELGGARCRGAVVARRAQAFSNEGDDSGLTDKVGPPVSEREATAESDKRSRRRPKRTSGRIRQAEQATAKTEKLPNRTSTPGSLTEWAHLSARGRRRPKQTSGGVGPWLGWKIREEAGPKIRKKGISEIKIRFLNLPRLWKFVEEDLGGILT